ncbi:MAG TPA: hypothetical protein VM783_17590 [Candidatus Acidoferrum sp.]|nr:hypothetical protein [Candidatus Acidoferrum sp.]
MSYQEIIDYLDSLPGVLALFWFMENVSDEHLHRQQLFFYCRERARRYQHNYKAELKYDAIMFKKKES